MEATVVQQSSRPETVRTLVPQLRAAGLPAGGTVLVHSSLSRLGWVAGGAQAVVEALTAALGPGLLGVGHGNNTTLHLAEHWSGRGRETVEGSPVLVDGERRWVRYAALDWDNSDFPAVGAAYRESGGPLTAGRVGRADTLLLPVVPLVDFATGWFRTHRS